MTWVLRLDRPDLMPRGPITCCPIVEEDGRLVDDRTGQPLLDADGRWIYVAPPGRCDDRR